MSQNDAYRALKNSLFMFARMVIVLFIGLYTSRVVLRALGFEDYGIYNVVGSVVSFFTFLNVALSGSTSRYLSFELGSGDKDSLSRTYSMAINAHVLLAVFLVIILEAGGVWFINHKLNISPERLSAANWCFQFSVLSLAYYVITVPFNSSVIAHEHMNFYALVSIIEASKTPIWTINMGQWSSMAFLIGITGHRRLSLPNDFLIADMSNALMRILSSGSPLSPVFL